ncbi:uncharacterized protein LOC128951545 [Oppia nitens]|uniref:uncharacterized protein LOC128951545 n=1 Tax=Oppia nitens TaxID=1686743 RepID=UPI0023DBF721|nr:uncharacterized protein LOC128951545 [Oppia nitens]
MQHQYLNHHHHHQQQLPGQQLLPPILYHYTTTQGAHSIRRSLTIKPVKQIAENCDKGVQLSAMDPNLYFRSEIVDNIYGGGQSSGRGNAADECVVVYTNQLDPSRLRPVKQDLYVYTGTIKVVSAQNVIDKPRCVRAGGGPGNHTGAGGVPPQQWPVSAPLPQMAGTYASPQYYNTFSPTVQEYPLPPPPPPPQSYIYNTNSYAIPSAPPLPPGLSFEAYQYSRYSSPPPPYQADNNTNNNPGFIYSNGQQPTTGMPSPVQSMYELPPSMPLYTGTGIPIVQPLPVNQKLPTSQPIPETTCAGPHIVSPMDKPIANQHYSTELYGTVTSKPTIQPFDDNGLVTGNTHQPSSKQETGNNNTTGHQTIGYKQNQPSPQYQTAANKIGQQQQQQQTTGAQSSKFVQNQPSQQYQTVESKKVTRSNI